MENPDDPKPIQITTVPDNLVRRHVCSMRLRPKSRN